MPVASNNGTINTTNISLLTCDFGMMIATQDRGHPMKPFGYLGHRRRSVSIGGQSTSLKLEPEFWTALEMMAAENKISMAKQLFRIDSQRMGRSLASSVRVACFKWALTKSKS
jgi:predicted DNA-binding ribbon-helix-helix protein